VSARARKMKCHSHCLGNDHVETPPAGEQNVTIFNCLLYKYLNLYCLLAYTFMYI